MRKPKPIRRVTEAKAEEVLIGEPVAVAYRPSVGSHWMWGDGNAPNLSEVLRDVESMRAHPRCLSAMGYYKAGIANAKIKITKASSPEVAKWAEAEFNKFWQRGMPTAQGSYDYGWAGLEASYERSQNYLSFDRLDEFKTGDVFPTFRRGDYAGIRVKNLAPKDVESVPGLLEIHDGQVDLRGPEEGPAKAFWAIHNKRFHPWFGFTQYYGAHRPWRFLSGRDATESNINAAVYRVAVGPLIVRGPTTSKKVEGKSDLVPSLQKARQMAEELRSNAAVALPNSFNEKTGKYDWEVEYPTSTFDVGPLINVSDHWEKQISLGIGVPPELMEASETGSGYSGRAIPLEGFFAGQQQNALAMAFAWYWQIGDPLCKWNHGPEAWFEYEVLPLLMTRMKDLQGLQQPPQPGQPGQPGEEPQPGATPKAGAGWHPQVGPRGGQYEVNQAGDKRPMRMGFENDHPRDSEGKFTAAHDAIRNEGHPEHHPFGDIPLPKLFREMQRRDPELTIPEFHKTLSDLHQNQHIALQGWSGPISDVPEPQYAMSGTVKNFRSGAKRLDPLDKVHYYARLRTPDEKRIQMSSIEFALHAPKGGITIAGKSFRGGQFIPGKVAAEATPEQQERLRGAETERKGKVRSAIKTDTHVAEALKPYQDVSLTPGNHSSAKRAYQALKRYHGEDVGHRINQMIAADLDKIGSVGPDKISGLPHGSDRDEFYAKRLRAYSHMVDWAKKDISEGKIGKYGMRTVPLANLSVDPERFQFKVSGIGKGGVTEELKDVKRWRPEFAGAALAWNDPKDGKDYIVNGHHRYELAKRAGVNDMTVHYIKAASPEHARAIGALANVAEGRGTALDAAKFMRDTNTGPEDFAKEGVSLKGQLAKDATILKGLSDPLFHRLTQGTISQNRALAIAEELSDHGDQEQLVGYIDKLEDSGKKVSDDLAKEMALDIRQSAHSSTTEKTLFGDEETTKSVFLERNQLKQFIRTKLAAEANVFKAVASEKKGKALEKGGKNVIDVEANKKVAAENEAVKNLFSSMANYKGEISDAINEAATELAGDSKKRNKIQEALMEKVRGLAKQQLGMGDPAEIKEPKKQEIQAIPEIISPAGLTPAGENSMITPVAGDVPAEAKPAPEKKMENKREALAKAVGGKEPGALGVYLDYLEESGVQPHDLSPVEYAAVYKHPEQNRERLRSLGFTGSHKEQVMSALNQGKPVHPDRVNDHADAIEFQEKKKLREELGQDYVQQLRNKAAAPIHETLRDNGDGSFLVRMKQLSGGGFHEHKKGDIVDHNGLPKIVVRATNGGKAKADGGTWGYVQTVTLRDPKPKETKAAEKALAAARAIVQHDSQANNYSYPNLKKEQMAEHARLTRLAFGTEAP